MRESDGIGTLPSFPLLSAYGSGYGSSGLAHILTRIILRQNAKKVPKTKGFRNFGGKSTAHGYNAPCFDDMVHCFVGSGLIRRDNEDGKDNIKSAYRTV